MPYKLTILNIKTMDWVWQTTSTNMVPTPTEIEGNSTLRHPTNRLIMNILKRLIKDSFKIFRNKPIRIIINILEIQWATLINPNICINRDLINHLAIRIETPLCNKPITKLTTTDTIKIMSKDHHIYSNELCCKKLFSLI